MKQKYNYCPQFFLEDQSFHFKVTSILSQNFLTTYASYAHLYLELKFTFKFSDLSIIIIIKFVLKYHLNLKVEGNFSFLSFTALVHFKILFCIFYKPHTQRLSLLILARPPFSSSQSHLFFPFSVQSNVLRGKLQVMLNVSNFFKDDVEGIKHC